MLLDELDENGFTILNQAIAPPTIQAWSESLDAALQATQTGTLSSRDQVYGSRNILESWPGISDASSHASVASCVRRVLGSKAGLVRVLFFDKPPGRSWSLPWHRDLTIAVREHHADLGEFRCPTVKSGQPHVEAPTWLLQQMVTLRIHLDPMTDANGPLVVIPRSHKEGKQAVQTSSSMKTILCDAGSILVMRPLLSHSSRHSVDGCDARRRILHLEFAATNELPNGYQWQHFENVPNGDN